MTRLQFEKVYDKYFYSVYHVAIKYLKTEEAASKVAEHVFTSLLNNYHASEEGVVDFIKEVTKNKVMFELKRMATMGIEVYRESLKEKTSKPPDTWRKRAHLTSILGFLKPKSRTPHSD